MSENNNDNNKAIITEAELLPAEPYDFEFIAATLGLIPYLALGLDDQTTFQGALSPGAVINFEITEEGHGAFTLHGGEEVIMSEHYLADFEKTLRRQIENNKAKAKEAMRDQIKMQVEIAAEMQSGVQPGMIVGTPPQGRRFRQ